MLSYSLVLVYKYIAEDVDSFDLHSFMSEDGMTTKDNYYVLSFLSHL